MPGVGDGGAAGVGRILRYRLVRPTHSEKIALGREFPNLPSVIVRGHEAPRVPRHRFGLRGVGGFGWSERDHFRDEAGPPPGIGSGEPHQSVDAPGTPATHTRETGMTKLLGVRPGPFVAAAALLAAAASDARASYGGGGCHRCAPEPVVATTCAPVVVQPQYTTVMQTVYETVYEREAYTLMETPAHRTLRLPGRELHRPAARLRDLDGRAQLHRPSRPVYETQNLERRYTVPEALPTRPRTASGTTPSRSRSTRDREPRATLYGPAPPRLRDAEPRATLYGPAAGVRDREPGARYVPCRGPSTRRRPASGATP